MVVSDSQSTLAAKLLCDREFEGFDEALDHCEILIANYILWKDDIEQALEDVGCRQLKNS